MMTIDAVQAVRNKFSNAAERYEKLAFIQNGLRQELYDNLTIKNGSTVLDVGCGTGRLLTDIAHRNPKGVNVGIDSARGMVQLAKLKGARRLIVQADACRLPFKPKSFDLLVSTSSYQWAGDLKHAFTSARDVLKPWGTFQFFLFGRKTLWELFDSLEAAAVLTERTSGKRRLPTKKDVWYALDWSKFRDVSVHVEERVVMFRDLWTILVWLKGLGANNLGHRVFLGRRALEKAQDHYARNHGTKEGLKVTFEVIWVRATR